MKQQNGFLLMEALVLILVLSVVFVSFMGLVTQALKISSRSHGQSEAIMKIEKIVFEIGNGLRPDLASFGGQENLGPGISCAIKADSASSFALIKSKAAWKNGKEFLDFSFLAPEAAIHES